MERISSYSNLPLIFTYLTCFQILVYQASLASSCLDFERQALTKFREGLNDPSRCLSSWDAPNCCKWRGITCDNTTGYVVKLDLRNPYMGNESMSGFWNLSGQLDPALSRLKHLKHLDLSGNIFGNTLDGIQFPEFIASFKELRYLNLSSGMFTGRIPDQLGNLSNIEYLDISYNFLHAKNLQWLANKSPLKYLNLVSVNLSEVRDNWVQVINEIPSLVELHMVYCGLSDIAQTLDYNNLTSLRVLDLSQNTFNSSIPKWIGNMTSLTSLSLYTCSFHGPVPYSFSELPELKYLYLMQNKDLSADCSKLFDGSWSSIQRIEIWTDQVNGELYGEIPAVIGNITTLVYLDLFGNKIVGGLPTKITNLSNLEVLILDQNLLRGSLPNGIGHLQNLKYLSLSGCKLTGSIPPSIGRLSSLQYLRLDDSMLTGPIPESIGGLSSLQFLLLARNQLNGSIPMTLGQLSKLITLDLSSNSLVGTVTELHFEKLTDLNNLDLSFNCLVFKVRPDWVPLFQAERIYLSSCILGPLFPAWLRTQKFVTSLHISNASISDTIPSWFWDLTPQLDQLNLSNNKIDVQLPSTLKTKFFAAIDLSSNIFRGPIPQFSSPSYVDLSDNLFSGEIPLNITLMFYFFASKNQINGPIPRSIGKYCELTVLDLSHNKLNGQIPPSLGDCGSLQTLDLSSNLIFGSIPSSLGLLSRIETLQLSDNHLSGELPLSLKNCSNLEAIDMGGNKLSGNIPAWIGESFPTLKILSLRSNMFTGEIPPQLSYLTSLQVIDLSHNLLFGPIPQSFGNFVAMQSKQKKIMDLGYREDFSEGWIIYYQQSLVVTMKGMQLEYNRTLSLVTCVDLSHNNLYGEIPENLTLLLGLRALNLSGNNLSGEIPNEIGRLVLLESLDLSRNRLFGKIPQSMSSLTFLSYLNLSNNNFTGRIPSGHQLQTLNDPSIYSGNQQLCGDPLPKKCEEDETPQSPGEEHDSVDGDWIEIEWFSIGLAPGFVFGFWAVLGILMLKRSWRIAFFHFIDKVKESLFCGW